MNTQKVQLILEAIDRASAPFRRFMENVRQHVARVNASLSSMAKRFKAVGDKVTEVGKAVSVKLSAPIALVGGLALRASASFESMGIALNTAFQGNKAAAKDAFDLIVDFTTTTPFQLDQVLNSFIKLKNMGLDPSLKSLTSYGNTASAMNKSLDQMVEAVADAATGEFERLKEFGIKARSEGNRVAFTFRGQTQVVKKNAEAIQQYLLSLGDTFFAGGMADQAKSLGGVFSNLKDAVNISLRDMGDQIVRTTSLKDKVRSLIENLQSLTDWFTSLSPAVRDLIVWFGIFLAVLGPIILAIGQLIIGIGAMAMALKFVYPGLALVAMGFKAVGVAILTTPIGWIIAGITALAGLAYLLVSNWDWVSKQWSLLWDGIVGVAKNAWDAIQPILQPLIDMVTMLANGVSAVGSFIGGNIETAVNYINGNDGSNAPVSVTSKQQLDTSGTIEIILDSRGNPIISADMNNANTSTEVKTGSIMGGAL